MESDRLGRFRLTASGVDLQGRKLSVAAERFKPFELVLSGDLGNVLVRLKPITVELTGRVLDADTGQPVAGASVSMMGSTVSADDGSYRLQGVPVGLKLSLRTSKTGYIDQDTPVLVRDVREAEYDVLLSRATDVTVEVFDRITGRPIPGAEVRRGEFEDLLARTDSTGCFTVSVARGTIVMRHVSAAGYGYFLWLWTPADVDDTVRPRIPLQPGVTIDGVVTNGQSQTITGAAVVVFRSGQHDSFLCGRLTEAEREELGVLGSGSFIASMAGAYAKTDPEGGFSIGAVACDRPYGIYVTHQDYVPQRVEGIFVVSPGDHASVAIVLDEGATVRGRVVMNGKPLPGVGVVGGGARTATDEHGTYVLRRVKPGVVRLTTIHGREATLTVESGKSYEHDFIWEHERLTVRGSVMTPAGRPLEEVRVWAECGGRCSALSTRGKTNADGRYTVLVGNHAHRITARHGAARSSLEGIAPNSTAVDFVLPDLQRMTIQLVDSETRLPIVQAGSTVMQRVSARVSGTGEFRTVSCDLDLHGELELDLPIGSVDLHIHFADAGYAPYTARGLWVDPDRSGPPPVIALERGIAIELAIVDAENYAEAREGHLVFFLEESQLGSVRGPFARQGAPSTMSIGGINVWLENAGLTAQLAQFDEQGACRMTGLAPGTYSLRALPDDIAFSPESIDVRQGASSPVEVGWRSR